MIIGQSGLKLIQFLEGFSKRAYEDVKGCAICFGNHEHPNGKPVKIGDIVTFDKFSNEAANYIQYHLKRYVYKEIESKIKVSITTNQFDALCSLIYNLGNLPVSISTLINEKKITEIQPLWNSYNRIKKDGVLTVDSNLIDRRSREWNLFSSGRLDIPTPVKNPPVTSVQDVPLVVSVAISQIGVKEIPIGSNLGPQINNYCETIGIARGNHWCMAFVYWCYEQACKQMGIKNPLQRTAKVLDQWTLTEKQYRKYPNQPELIIPGCLFVIDSGGGNGHTGIVEKVEKGYAYTIEGNTNDSGSRDGDGVYRRKRLISKLNGFIVFPHLFNNILSKSKVNTSYSTKEGDNDKNTENNRPTTPDYTFIVNNDENITTVQQFIDTYNILLTPDELLSFSEYDNKAALFASYTSAQRKQYNQQANINFIGQGAKIAVPFNKIKSGSIYNINQTIVENKNYKSFLEGQMLRLLKDPQYVKLNSINNGRINDTGAVYKKADQCKIWIWSKAINKDGGYLIDVTEFVETITTNVNDNGGNFSISLPHITFRDNFAYGQKIETLADIFTTSYVQTLHTLESAVETLRSYLHKTSSHNTKSVNSSDYISELNTDEGGFLNNGTPRYFKRNNSFFYHMMQNNDMIFIRMERIALDKAGANDESDFKVNSTRLPENVFDMIGLIDTSVKNSDGQGNNQNVTLSGRDVSKVLIDDGVYFFDVEYALQDREQIIKNSTAKKCGNRLIIPPLKDSKGTYEGNLQKNLQGYTGDVTFNFTQTQSIEEYLVFIFSQLTNIDICPDNLFKAYKNENFIISREPDTERAGVYNYKKIKANGIWQLIKLVIDPEVGNRRVADQGFTTATGSLLNLIRKVCQPPFIEFFMDTYGDRYYFICRKPPFAESAYKTNYILNVFDDDVEGDTLNFNSEFFTWFKLNPTGSIIESTDGKSMVILPAVMLPEYMEVWGSRVLDVTTQYLDFDQSQSDQSKDNITKIVQQGREDLDWLIETNAYLPFTTCGTITIKPDRRFKRGMNIRYMPTGEIFYVDAVTNTRQYGEVSGGNTTLHVSRGIVEKHYSKYFQIVNLLKNSKNTGGWQKNTWTVNQEIFNFFLERRQFID